MIEKGYQETVQIRVFLIRGFSVTEKGVGLVGQGEDQVRLIPAGVLITPDHGDTVEKVAGIYHHGGRSGIDKDSHRG